MRFKPGEGNIPCQSRTKTSGESSKALGTEDRVQCCEDRPVLEGTRLHPEICESESWIFFQVEPGLDHGEGDHDRSSKSPGSSSDEQGLASVGFSVEDVVAHPVHGGEVEADPRYGPARRGVINCTEAIVFDLYKEGSTPLQRP